MMKRSEFLAELDVATRIAKSSRITGSARAWLSLIHAQLAFGETSESNPILKAVLDVAYIHVEPFAVMAAAERAWEYYEERERATRGHIPGFAPSAIGTGALVPSSNQEAQASIDPNDSHDFGYGHGI